MISRIRRASKQAAHDTAASMTQELRQKALSKGWDKDVVEHMSVAHEDGKFNVKVHPKYADRAFVHEFGDEHHRPNAVIRQYSNHPEESLKSHLGNMNKYYKETR